MKGWVGLVSWPIPIEMVGLHNYVGRRHWMWPYNCTVRGESCCRHTQFAQCTDSGRDPITRRSFPREAFPPVDAQGYVSARESQQSFKDMLHYWTKNINKIRLNVFNDSLEVGKVTAGHGGKLWVVTDTLSCSVVQKIKVYNIQVLWNWFSLLAF